MVTIHADNIFNSGCLALVNPVNCCGVMGAGLAKEFKERFPDMFGMYQIACKNKQLELGKIWVWLEQDGKLIINFPTKHHWTDKSQLINIDKGLAELSQFCKNHKVPSIAIPALGAGLGGLKTESVMSLVLKYFTDIETHAKFYGVVIL